MTELYPTDAQLNDLSGTTDNEQEVLFIPTGESPYYTSFYKMLYRLLDVARRAGDLRVYKDGALTFGVRPGRYLKGDTAVNYVGSTGNALTNNATNYIYLDADGTLTVNTTGFPSISETPHVRLASIVTSAGDYSINDGDITDCRGWAMFAAAGATVGKIHDLTDAAIDITADKIAFSDEDATGDPNRREDVADLIAAMAGDGLQQNAGTKVLDVDVSDFAGDGLEDDGAENLRVKLDGGTIARSAAGVKVADNGVAVGQLAAALQDLMPNLGITAGAEAADTRTITVQARDAANNNLAERVLVRVWISTADYGAPDATGNTVAVSTGATYETETANAAYKIISDANGTVAIDVTISGAASRYVMAEIDGRIYSSGQVDWAA